MVNYLGKGFSNSDLFFLEENTLRTIRNLALEIIKVIAQGWMKDIDY